MEEEGEQQEQEQEQEKKKEEEEEEEQQQEEEEEDWDEEEGERADEELRAEFNRRVRAQVSESLELLRKALPAAASVTVDEFASTIGMLRQNVVGTSTEGMALYAYHSCLNHSDAPNAEVLAVSGIRGAHVVVATSEPVQEGEELTVSYLGPAPAGPDVEAWREWQGTLAEQYGIRQHKPT